MLALYDSGPVRVREWSLEKQLGVNTRLILMEDNGPSRIYAGRKD
jgi:hypothetical protein